MNKDNPLIKLIKRTIYMDKGNYIVSFTGHPNAGKSYGAMDLCESFDETFDNSRICFTLEEFFKLMIKMSKDKSSVGKALMLDEAGVAGNSKKAMHTEQVAYGEILKMMRFKRNLFVITSPKFNDYIKDGRQLVDAWLHYDKREKTLNEVLKKQKSQTIARLRFISNNEFNNKTYYVPMRISADTVMQGIIFDKPSKKLISAYELRKNNNFNNKLQENLAKLQQKKLKQIIYTKTNEGL